MARMDRKVWQIDERNLVKNRCRTFVKSLYGDLGDIGGKRGRVEYLGDVESSIPAEGSKISYHWPQSS